MKRATVVVCLSVAMIAGIAPWLLAAAPTTVGDLRVQAVHIQAVALAWSVPSEPGGVGLGSLQRSGIPPPPSMRPTGPRPPRPRASRSPAPGTTDRFTVTGLAPSTLYYFAIKTADASLPANVSALSNIASGTTLPPIAPVTVHNPWLVNDRVADTHNLGAMAATYVKAYTPGGVVPPASDEDKAINIYNNQKRRLYHWADEPPSVGGGDINDPTYNQNVFGWCLCGRHASQGCTIAQAAGLGQRRIGLPGHWVYEVQYGDGTYHLYDTMTTMYVFSKSTPRHVANCAEIKADHSLITSAIADNRACPGLLLCGDDPAGYCAMVDSWSDNGSGAVTPGWTGAMDLRSGQSFKRTWESWLNEHPTPQTDADGFPGADPPFHHEARHDNQDYVNFAYWEPYALTTAQSSAINVDYTPTYRRWANGTDTLAPDFRSAGYQAMLYSGTGISTYYQDAITPDLHAATVNVQGEAVFKISVPYYLVDANFSGTFVRTTASDVCNVLLSTNGTSWTPVYTAPVGTATVTNQNLRTNVFNNWSTWYIKVQVKGAAALANAGVSNFVVVTTFEHNKGAMAYLDKGVNHVTLTFDNPAELAASGNYLHVVYKWKEYSGGAWTVDRQFETYTTSSPATFTIATGGSKVPRTEYILLEVTPPPFDPIPPAPIVDLACYPLSTRRIALAWTATGDDGSSGTANAYDLRYSTAPITDDASFNAATQATSVPPPGPAGTPESFVLLGLTPGTNYYFAIEAIDKVGNRSPLSNVVAPCRTFDPDLVPPEAVSDLAAEPGSTDSTASLTWTAPADYGAAGAGPFTCVSYDLRCSTAPIDAGHWASATAVANVPAPKAPGSAESFTVTGLQGRTTYYFAIRSTDEDGNVSDLSACAGVRTTGQLVLNPMADAGLYGAGSDYSNRGTGGRMDVGLTQDALLTFDLAGKLAADEMVTGATLVLGTARQGYSFNLQVVAYPLVAPWGEGIGNGGTVGDLGFPWAPASIGDAVWAFQRVTAVGPGSGSFAGSTVATAGIPWAIPGGRGVGSDVLDRQLFAMSWARTVGPNDAAGSPMPAMPFTPIGVGVVRGWSCGTVDNNGLNIWATSGSGYAAVTTREFNGTKPQLTLTIGLSGDVDGDSHVDVIDLLYLVDAFGSLSSDPAYDPACDFNGDASVDVIDLLMLVDTFGR